MPTLRPLRIAIVAGDRFSRSLGKLDSRLAGIGKRAGAIGRSLSVGITLPAIGAGIAAGRLASQFDSTFGQIEGLVGVTGKELEALEAGTLKVAKSTGRLPGELAKAAFFITSAGLRGKNALDLLLASAQGAAAGLGETEVVADATSSAINAYGSEVLSAGKATGILVAAVREGKVEASSLAPVLGRIVPVASELGVGFDQVAASISAMTRLGANAEEATTGLLGVLNSMLKPAAESEKALRRMGLSSKGLRQQLREEGLLSVLSTLREEIDGNEAALGRVFPNVRALSAFLNLMGKNADVTRAIFGSLANATEKDLANALDPVASRAGFKFEQALAAINVLGIELGDKILPAVVPWVEKFTGSVGGLADRFGKLSPGVKKFLTSGAFLVIVLGPIVVAFGALAAALSAVVGFIGLIGAKVAIAGAAIIGLGAALIAAWQPLSDLLDTLIKKFDSVVKLSGLTGTREEGLALSGQKTADPVTGVFGTAAERESRSRQAVAAAHRAIADVINVRSEVRGRLDVRIDGNGRPIPLRQESSDNFDLLVTTGLTAATP